MTDQYRTLASEHAYEPPPTKNSRFLAFVAPAASEEEAGAFLDRISCRKLCQQWRFNFHIWDEPGMEGEASGSILSRPRCFCPVRGIP